MDIDVFVKTFVLQVQGSAQMISQTLADEHEANINFMNNLNNKTKYFRLCLSYKVKLRKLRA